MLRPSFGTSKIFTEHYTGEGVVGQVKNYRADISEWIWNLFIHCTSGWCDTSSKDLWIQQQKLKKWNI